MNVFSWVRIGNNCNHVTSLVILWFRLEKYYFEFGQETRQETKREEQESRQESPWENRGCWWNQNCGWNDQRSWSWGYVMTFILNKVYGIHFVVVHLCWHTCIWQGNMGFLFCIPAASHFRTRWFDSTKRWNLQISCRWGKRKPDRHGRCEIQFNVNHCIV